MKKNYSLLYQKKINYIYLHPKKKKKKHIVTILFRIQKFAYFILKIPNTFFPYLLPNTFSWSTLTSTIENKSSKLLFNKHNENGLGLRGSPPHIYTWVLFIFS
jgi:hypothetical protein